MATVTNDISLAIRQNATMEPTPEEAADGSILVKVLAAVLERLVNSNKVTAVSDPGQLTKFHALKPPGIGVEAYLDRVHKYASCSNECFILALIYVDRLIERNNFLLTELNVHRVVITAILLAAKFFDDAYYNNAYYAKVGGVLVSELNGLEVDFLFRINFSLHVLPEVFEKYKAELVSHAINSGLIPAPMATPASVSQQLPNIPEMGSGSGNSNVHMSGEIINPPQNNQQHQHNQQQLAMQDTANNDSMMGLSMHVTPSPTNSLEDVSQMANNTMIDPARTSSAMESKDANEMMTMHGAAALEPFSNKLVIQQQKQQTMLHRANSLPPFPSTSCTNHSLKLPYSAPTLPTSAPMMAVDQVQYQLVVNQLFPIENTLVHHNHQGVGTTTTASTIQDHHSNATAGLVGHHHGLGGPGLGPMAYQVSWSGQIR